MLRSFLRDARPLSRAVRRLEDDWFMNEWPARKVRRVTLPIYEHPVNMMEDMSRQMADTLRRMQEFVDDIESLDELTNRFEGRERRNNAVLKRTESGGLQLALEVGEFKPEDLKIKLVEDHLVVEAENESAGEDSYRKSHFKRWFALPEDCKVDEIKSRLTDDGRLVIDLPLNKPLESKARTIPIEMAKERPANESQQGERNSVQNENHPEHEESGDQARRSARRQ